MSHVSTRYVCRHGRTEPERDDGNPWCVECECAPFVSDEDVAPLRAALEAWHPPGPAQARDLMAIEVAARRRAEKERDDQRAESVRGFALLEKHVVDMQATARGEKT